MSKASTILPKDLGEPDILVKIVLVGDSGVGKTNLLSQFVRNQFNEDSRTTIGVEFATKTMVIKGKNVKAQIWDTAGQERYRAITSSYYKNAIGAMILYDITSSISFSSVSKWIDELREHSDPNITLMLVGNKSDLVAQRSVDIAQAKNFAEKNKMLFIETSAKDACNVPEAFTELMTVVIDYLVKENLDGLKPPSSYIQPQGIPIAQKHQDKSPCC